MPTFSFFLGIQLYRLRLSLVV